MKQQDAHTAYQVIVCDGQRCFPLRFHGDAELRLLLSLATRRQLDAIVHVGSRPGINPAFVLDAIHREIRDRVEETAARLKAQRSLEGAGRSPLRNLAHWLQLAKLS